MSGRHAADPKSRPGFALGVLAVIGLTPPALIVGPQLAQARGVTPVSRPDIQLDKSPADVEISAAGTTTNPKGRAHDDCVGGSRTAGSAEVP